MTTLIGYDSIFLKHLTGAHPERPERLVSVVNGLQEAGLWEGLEQVALLPSQVENDTPTGGCWQDTHW